MSESDLTEEERQSIVEDMMEEIEKGKSNSPDDEFEEEFLDNSDNTLDENYEPSGKKKKSSNSKKGNKKITKKEKEFADKVAVCKEVSKHPAIYQIIHRDYSNKQIREKIWHEISKSLNESVGEHMTIRQCKKTWEALRESTR